jgi:hypothetical protein
VFAVTFALAGTLGLGCGAAQTSAAGARHPVLHPTETGVRGLGFASRERVRVVATGSQRVVRRLRAGAGGGFVVAVPGIESCTGFTVVATGSDGSRATYKRAPGQCALP